VESSASAPKTASTRAASIDLLRGVVMVIMALDHTRDFFGSTAFEPTDLDKTNAPLFFTRWITHFCAPVFVFLAGTAAWLSRGKKSDSELTRFLISRGVWLVFLEVVVITFLWSFRAPFSFTILQVFWALGTSMIVLAAVVRLPVRVITIFGLAIVLGHDALDHLHPFKTGDAHVAWSMFHESAFDLSIAGHHVGLVYPIVPWCGVMMLGYAFGSRFVVPNRSVEDRSRETLRLGVAITLFFVVIRASNIYGDPTPWTARGDIGTLLSFLNCEKYPPSLCYLAMTLGPALMLLALFDRSGVGESNAFARAVVVYGRVPLFYYLLHIALIHLTSNALFWISTHRWRVGWSGDNRLNIGLPLTYVSWLAIVLGLYLPCRWFANVKASAWGREQRWLSYL
jgi:uncharacterized membrane protein